MNNKGGRPRHLFWQRKFYETQVDEKKVDACNPCDPRLSNRPDRVTNHYLKCMKLSNTSSSVLTTTLAGLSEKTGVLSLKTLV